MSEKIRVLLDEETVENVSARLLPRSAKRTRAKKFT